MQHDGVGRIVGAVGAEELGGQSADGKRRRNLHHRAEQQLGLHHGQGDVKQLLQPVAHPVDAARLIQGGIDALEAGDKGQEPGAQAHPQLHQHQHPEIVGRVGQPLNRFLDKPDIHQRPVDEPVGVPAEQKLPDEEHRRARQGRRIKEEGQQHPQPVAELVNQPRQPEAEQVADRAGQQGQQQGVAHGDAENLIVDKEVDVILQPDEGGCLEHIVVAEAEHRRHQHRQQDHQEKEQEKEELHEEDPKTKCDEKDLKVYADLDQQLGKVFGEELGHEILKALVQFVCKNPLCLLTMGM